MADAEGPLSLDQLSFDSLQDTYTVEWNAYRANHEEVWKDIVRRVLHEKRFEGVKRISMQSIFGEIRKRGIPRDPQRVVALDNNWTACAARDLLAAYPELEGFIRIRPRKKS